MKEADAVLVLTAVDLIASFWVKLADAVLLFVAVELIDELIVNAADPVELWLAVLAMEKAVPPDGPGIPVELTLRSSQLIAGWLAWLPPAAPQPKRIAFQDVELP
jgi:hypothetical protein